MPLYYEPHSRYGPQMRRPYGLFSFLLDVLMIIITSGFWFIWIFVRELRNR